MIIYAYWCQDKIAVFANYTSVLSSVPAFSLCVFLFLSSKPSHILLSAVLTFGCFVNTNYL